MCWTCLYSALNPYPLKGPFGGVANQVLAWVPKPQFKGSLPLWRTQPKAINLMDEHLCFLADLIYNNLKNTTQTFLVSVDEAKLSSYLLVYIDRRQLRTKRLDLFFQS